MRPALVSDVHGNAGAGGHIHLQFVRRVGDALFVNPGSAGFSYDHEQAEEALRADPWAAYALVETGEDGELDVSFRRVPMDVGALVDALLASGMPAAGANASRRRPR